MTQPEPLWTPPPPQLHIYLRNYMYMRTHVYALAPPPQHCHPLLHCESAPPGQLPPKKHCRLVARFHLQHVLLNQLQQLDDS